jgi:hypothetical protein
VGIFFYELKNPLEPTRLKRKGRKDAKDLSSRRDSHSKLSKKDLR